MGAAMGTCYSHLNLAERIEIYRLKANGLSNAAIAQKVGRHRSTIGRELARNSKPTKQYRGGYKPDRAHDLALRRRRWDARFKLARQPALRRYVRKRLAMGWSPEQIAGRLALDDAPMRISYESIYRFVYHRSAQKDYWHRLLPQRKHKRGRLKRGGIGSVHYIKQRRGLDERSEAAALRLEPGHWEADLMSFSAYGQYLLVLHERVSRLSRIVRLTNKTAAHVAQQIASMMTGLPVHLKKSITFDNGSEFAHHYKLAAKLKLETFFCDPHAPWQKGGIENAIGRFRRPLPRKTNLTQLTQQQLRQAVWRYNRTPRKCLGYMTPSECFNRVALQT
jgi:IS30 family transposase